MQVGPQNVVQVITDNAPVCKAASMLINLALKNICAAKNIESNEDVYVECHWITEVGDKALMIKNYILNHNMVLTMFNQFAPLKLISIAQTRFASILVMLKRFKLVKRALESMVLCNEWKFTAPIYDMLRFADTDRPSLHLIYDMWDDMIEKVKNIIYRHEEKELTEGSEFYDVVYAILTDRWTKSSSPLHCFAHSLNPRYYSDTWLSASPNRIPPHLNIKLSEERNKCLKRYFPSSEARTAVNIEFARFSGQMDIFGCPDSVEERGIMEPRMWWIVRGALAPNLQKIALKLLCQPCSSSCSIMEPKRMQGKSLSSALNDLVQRTEGHSEDPLQLCNSIEEIDLDLDDVMNVNSVPNTNPDDDDDETQPPSGEKDGGTCVFA
ncbi:uncharacterized protein LOC124934094 [Impatiens glandulifera]|uniref:uncharacterized protein LOC124934094 n=1 Tax=Impatiens glandulifera TaxID=253017 RepID=UPI001FB0DD78|nr:uncharacterized protein LOC124934094 [Impatiens glandulifera]